MKKKKAKSDIGFRGALYVLITVLLVFNVVSLMIYSASIEGEAEEVVTDKLTSYYREVLKNYTSTVMGMNELVKINADMIASGTEEYDEAVYTELLTKGEENSSFKGNLYYIVEKDHVISAAGGILEEINKVKEVYNDLINLPHYNLVNINNERQLMICNPIKREDNSVIGAVVAFSSVNNFLDAIVDAGNKGSTFYYIITQEGDIIQSVSSNRYYSTEESNIKTALAEADFTDNDIRTIFSNIRVSRDGYTEFMNNGHVNYLFHMGSGIGGSGMITVADGDYITRLITQQTKSTSSLLTIYTFVGISFVVIMIIIICIDRTREQNAKKALLNQAETDQLTKLYNKVATEDYIKAYIENDGKNQLAALFVIDLDNFKKINDTLGHAFGDEVLRSLGRGLRSEFRVDDIVGRIGGDEFVIFLKNMKTEEIIKKEGERLERFFRNFRVGEYVKYATTASIGASIYPTDGMNFRELYMLADQALYHSKKKGKNRLSFYEKRNVVTESEHTEEEPLNKDTNISAG